MSARPALIAFITLMLALPALAQEATPEAAPPAEPTISLSQLENAVLRAELAADMAEQSVSISGSLLNLFDGIALILTVGGVLLGLFGARSIQDTRRISRELRAEGDQLRARVLQESEERAAELAQLRQSFEASARETTLALQKRTDNALLAISLLEQGERQYRATDYQGAASVYELALALDDHNPFIHQRLGYVYGQLGDVESALDHYTQALAAAPDSPSAIAGMGFITRRIAERMPPGVEQDLRFSEAEMYLLKALRMSPRLVDDDGESWWGVLGGLYRRRGYLDKAIHAYEQATRVTPQSSYGFSNLALLYVKRGERDRMEDIYRRVETIAVGEALSSTSNFWGYADLVVARLALGKVEQAHEDLNTALNIAPRNADWMLEGLRDTLADLSQYVEPPRQADIRRAIRAIEATLTRLDQAGE